MKRTDAFLAKIAFLTHFKLVFKAFLILGVFIGLILFPFMKEPIKNFFQILGGFALFLVFLYIVTLIYLILQRK
ncbi:hypothetical protein B6S12_10000 [Helicobacter valdiviensis]|uniref:Uncharacterized protein n=1 Tax=Helicobacter valdiviensis TaxID=1458358 RepID=A0A2W6MRV5_9HELI|nr:hypothetical protein B6S12_10000 [Helicobacter valdiviensis]